MSDSSDDRDRSIEELRRTVYARGSDPDAVRAAADELARRAAIEAAARAAGASAAPAQSGFRAVHPRWRVGLIAGLATLAVVAGVALSGQLTAPTVHTAAHTATPTPASSPLHKPSPPTGELPDVFPSNGTPLDPPDAGGTLLATATSTDNQAQAARPQLSSTSPKLLVTVICRGKGEVLVELNDGQESGFPCSTTAKTTRHEYYAPLGQFQYSVDASGVADWALAIASASSATPSAAASTAASAAGSAAKEQQRRATPTPSD